MTTGACEFSSVRVININWVKYRQTSHSVTDGRSVLWTDNDRRWPGCRWMTNDGHLYMHQSVPNNKYMTKILYYWSYSYESSNSKLFSWWFSHFVSPTLPHLLSTELSTSCGVTVLMVLQHCWSPVATLPTMHLWLWAFDRVDRLRGLQYWPAIAWCDVSLVQQWSMADRHAPLIFSLSSMMPLNLFCLAVLLHP